MTEPASPTATAVTPAPGTYMLDPEQTTVRANTRAMFGLLKVKGTFQLMSGQVVIAADPAGSTATATIAAASFDSGAATRDGDVVSRALLDAQGFPEITFLGRGARPDGAGWVLAGTVTAHGTPVASEVRVTQAAVAGDGTVRFGATARLDRTSFGVTRKKGMVGRMVEVIIEAVARPA